MLDVKKQGLNRSPLCGLLVQLSDSALMTLITRNEDISPSRRVINIDHTGFSIKKSRGNKRRSLSPTFTLRRRREFSLARGYFRKEINTNK